MSSHSAASSDKKPIWQGLFFQVVVATCIGIVLGIFYPHFAESLKPLGDGFIRLIKMIFAPVIALTVILGVARMETMRDLGRVGVISLVYFEVVSTFALILGLAAVHLLQPGRGMNIDPDTLDTKALASFTAAKTLTFEDFVLNIIPTSVIDAFAKNDVLQIIFFSVLLGVALSALRGRAKPLVDALESLTESVFYIVRLIMRLAPLGTLGAIDILWEKPWIRYRTKGDPDWRYIESEESIHGNCAIDRACADLVAALDTPGYRPLLTVDHAIQHTEVIFATFESSRRRGRVDLPLDKYDSALITMTEQNWIGPNAN